MRILIVHEPGTVGWEVAKAMCRGASRFAEVRVLAADDVDVRRELGDGDVLVVAVSGAGRGVRPLLDAIAASGMRAAVVGTRRPRPGPRPDPAKSLARRLRRRGVALLVPARTLRLDRRGALAGSEWERAHELGEDIVVAAGGTVRMERLLPDPVGPPPAPLTGDGAVLRSA
jgi:hypothetical protein